MFIKNRDLKIYCKSKLENVWVNRSIDSKNKHNISNKHKYLQSKFSTYQAFAWLVFSLVCHETHPNSLILILIAAFLSIWNSQVERSSELFLWKLQYVDQTFMKFIRFVIWKNNCIHSVLIDMIYGTQWWQNQI
jgi:hypothetical protein